jgi:hypothetical protein
MPQRNARQRLTHNQKQPVERVVLQKFNEEDPESVQHVV